MAIARSTSYSAPSGRDVTAGRRSGLEACLALVRAAPLGSWIPANLNTFQAAWPGNDYMAWFNGGPSSPAATIRAWSSFAWDDENCRAVLWGGGHANSSSNGLWLWEGFDRLWKVGFYDSDLFSTYDTVNGALEAPMSSHTYSNQVWLEKFKRFCTFGGADQPGGGTFKLYDHSDGSVVRNIHCYLADLSLAATGKIGGATGTNVKRGTTSALVLQGARAWQARDWTGLGNANTSYLGPHTNAWAAATVENGKDVVYLNTWGGGTSKGLLRIQFNDLTDAGQDQITVMGRPWDNINEDDGGVIDPVRKFSVSPGNSSNPFEGWNYNTPGTTNSNYKTPVSACSGDGLTDVQAMLSSVPGCGILFDSKRGKFVMWAWGGAIYEITPPSNLANLTVSGWVVDKIGDDTLSPRPLNSAEFVPAGDRESGVHGKWHYSENLDCYVGIQHSSLGYVWFYKPTDWVEP